MKTILVALRRNFLAAMITVLVLTPLLVFARPRTSRLILIGLPMALALGTALLLHAIDRTMHNRREAETAVGLPALFSVPDLRGGLPPDGPRLPVFDALATTLTSPKTVPVRALAVVAPGPETGCSTVAIQLALAAARQGKRTLLVDANLRLPKVHDRLGVPGDRGLSAILAGGEDALFEKGALRVLPAGPPPADPEAALSGLRAVVSRLATEHDLTVLAAGSSMAVAVCCDAALLVLRARETPRDSARDTRLLLEQAGVRIAGIVLNRQVEPEY